MSDAWQIALVAFLIVLNAVFAGSELALISLRPAQVERLRTRGGAGRALGRLASNPSRFLATIQIGITLAGFLASAAAAVSLADAVVPSLRLFGAAAEVLAIVVVTLILTFFTLVFGELAPKRIAMQHPEGWALAVARPLDFLASVTRPAVWLLSSSTDLVVRVFGGDPTRHREEVTEEEIKDLISAQTSFTDEEKQVISGAIAVGDRKLREVCVPRQLVTKIGAETTAADALRELIEAGHSRAPVFRDSTDNIIGVVSLRDLVGRDDLVAVLALPAPAFPKSAGVLQTLRDLQRDRQQMAIVIDEFGGFEGIVTVEDLIEEIVGEIYDEYDRDVAAVIWRADGSFELPGNFPFHDLIDLGIEAPSGAYTTIAGFILDELGHIPLQGEYVDVGGWRITIREVTLTSIVKLDARRAVDV